MGQGCKLLNTQNIRFNMWIGVFTQRKFGQAIREVLPQCGPILYLTGDVGRYGQDHVFFFFPSVLRKDVNVTTSQCSHLQKRNIDWKCGKLRIYNNLQSFCRCCLVCHISRCFAEQDDLLEFVGRLDNQVGDKSAGRDADLIMVCSWFEECMMFICMFLQHHHFKTSDILRSFKMNFDHVMNHVMNHLRYLRFQVISMSDRLQLSGHGSYGGRWSSEVNEWSWAKWRKPCSLLQLSLRHCCFFFCEICVRSSKHLQPKKPPRKYRNQKWCRVSILDQILIPDREHSWCWHQLFQKKHELYLQTCT